MPGPDTHVFVSYSRADASLVAPVVKLLRANQSLVFQDIDNIVPGKRWRGELERGLAQSHLVVVFWCSHASRSDEVAKEWQAAIAQNKDLLPLLLDATPLPAPLGEFQWIDFRDMVGANHAAAAVPDMAEPAPAPGPARPPRVRSSPLGSRWPSLAAMVTMVAVFTLAVLLATQLGPRSSQPDIPPVKTQPSTDPAKKPPVVPKKPPPPVQEYATFNLGGPVALGVALLVLGGMLWRWQRARRRTTTAPTATDDTPAYTNIEQNIASTLEAEILRRAALRHEARH
jgi:hypothetical protein